MRRTLTVALLGAAALPAASASCTSKDPPSDSSLGDAGQGGATQALVRVAHLSPGTLPIDFCVALKAGGAFIGPVLAGAGAAAGLPYSNVTEYLKFLPSRYVLRVVAGGASSCSSSLNGLPDLDLPGLSTGQVVTVAAIGENPVQLVTYEDDLAPPPGTTLQRFIHASPGAPAVDVGFVTRGSFAPLFANVSFGQSTKYAESGPISEQALSVRPVNTSTDALSIQGATVPAGPSITTFLIGVSGKTIAPLSALVCDDNAPPQNNLSVCVITGQAPGRSFVRLTQVSPDLPAIDVCFKTASAAAFSAPLLTSLGIPGGLHYGQATEYISLPTDFYDVRLVAAGSATCATPIVPDESAFFLPPTISVTVAALGLVHAPPGVPGFTLTPFVDSQEFYSPAAELRFIHASPGTPPVDVGLGTGAAFQPLFKDVAFGDTGSGDSISPLGYLTVPPFQNQTATVRLAGQSADSLSLPGISLGPDRIATAYAIGVPGSTTTPPAALLCLDNAPPLGPFAACTTAQAPATPQPE
jgi:hypothetical protein